MSFLPRFTRAAGTLGIAALICFGSGGALHAAESSTQGCVASSNADAPVICVANDGTVNAPNLRMHSHNYDKGNPIVWRTTNGKGLKITLEQSCTNVLALTSACDGSTPVCTALTVPTNAGACKYTTAVTGGGSVDPVIDTDSCCPPPY